MMSAGKISHGVPGICAVAPSEVQRPPSVNGAEGGDCTYVVPPRPARPEHPGGFWRVAANMPTMR